MTNTNACGLPFSIVKWEIGGRHTTHAYGVYPNNWVICFMTVYVYSEKKQQFLAVQWLGKYHCYVESRMSTLISLNTGFLFTLCCHLSKIMH